MMKYTHCPKCSRCESLAVAEDAVIVNPGPDGAVHVIGCTKCGWNRTSTHIRGITKIVSLDKILSPGFYNMEKSIRRFT